MTCRLTLAIVAALTLSACKSPGETAPAVSDAPADTAPATAGTLTADGYAPIRIGMTLDEVEQAVGAPDTAIDHPDECNMFHPERAPEGMLVMTETGRVSRITLTPGSTTVTDRGLKLGDTAAEVRQRLGRGARIGLHAYDDPPAEYITDWASGTPSDDWMTDPQARGIRYEIGADGRVAFIHAGGPSIQYVEGCS